MCQSPLGRDGEPIPEVISVTHREGREGVEKLSKKLLAWIADERNLELAWDHLVSKGGHAPGPDRMRYRDLPTRKDRLKLLRGLRDEIKDQRLRPGRTDRAPHR